MALEKRLREAGRAVDGLWTDDQATRDRLARIRRRLSPTASSAAVGTAPDAATAPDLAGLVVQCRRTLASSSEALHVRSSLRAVAGVTAVVGLSLVDHGPQRLREPALRLTERIARSTPLTDARAVALTDTDDLRPVLLLLGQLLGEAGVAAVGVAAGAEEEGVYWEMIEVIDAFDEARNTVIEMLRRLSESERSWSHHHAG